MVTKYQEVQVSQTRFLEDFVQIGNYQKNLRSDCLVTIFMAEDVSRKKDKDSVS